LPARVRTDRRWLTQAVVNLVNNAIKYTDQGKVEVRIGCEADASPARLKIAVEDTGVGIAPQDVERIFETFTQVRAMSQRTSEGFGLGLSIARSIAQRLGGALTVQSTLGRGSTFTLTVPVETPADVKWIEPGALPEHPGFVPVHRSRLQGRVLLADDAVDVRRTMTKALRDAGADVVAVADGVDALNAVRSPNEFDLILLDLRMPKLDGEKTAAELRRRGCRSAVIAFTAHAATGDRDTVVKAGFDDVWSKPISLQELVERASAYLPGTDSLRRPRAGVRRAPPVTRKSAPNT
jgi:CheY-like chemotaxis protein/anti-sigma regulatory factor (Ser/Thr protein kinase)